MSTVNWYGNELMVIAEGASDEMLAAFALNTEGVAKTGAPVDTGFLRNAMYSITPMSNGRGGAVGAARGAAERELAPTPVVKAHEAAMHAAAEYTIYQEMRVGFIYRALEDTAAQAGSVITQAGKKFFGG